MSNRYATDDTIAAVATAVGAGGIGIVRLSGPDALPILKRLLRPARPLTPRALAYGHIVDPATGEVVDEVLAAWMPAPHTYTCQDVVEIDGHGGPAPLRRILGLCLQHGARLAGPGEFTLRAFLNGRIDLAQAEAVADLVEAQTEAGLRLAVDQLDGHLSQRVRQIRERLLAALAWLEASIDFEADEIPSYDIDDDLNFSLTQLDALLAGANRGLIYRQGVRAAIVGRPNVGKSSLLNALLRVERAIVAPQPGTTRDTLEETLNLNGIPLVLVDTAGIRREIEGEVEGLGVERSRRALAQADLAVLVVDGSAPLEEGDHEIAALIGTRPALVAINKTDLPSAVDAADLLPGAPQVEISALTGEGLHALEGAIEQAVFSGAVTASDAALVGSPRHRDVLRRAREGVQDAAASQRTGQPADLISVDVTGAINALGEITGETASESLLETIFSRFCIGK
ncbi:MAG: tRNA uridine-5-carboxymethylaminomethyl(34) synthesis GTPase MnmE [Anaerolineae bacterium]|nr:tRNA uridine-5-carboxymethylaminomethyl(34) synthesis GTPase MnmE [Anaerolineae bacterium]